jgi:molybdopterin converting factor subunit 1
VRQISICFIRKTLDEGQEFGPIFVVMKIRILAFGIARDIMGNRHVEMEVKSGATMADLRETIHSAYPKLQELKHLHLSLNGDYAEGSEIISEQDEIAIIPPVSGG